jgi:dihydroorotate dehydrogenase (NAD+) catalytic subunit
MGGVSSGDDVLDLVAAGASAVALGTVLFLDPLAPARIRGELASVATPPGIVFARGIHGFARDSVSHHVLSSD